MNAICLWYHSSSELFLQVGARASSSGWRGGAPGAGAGKRLLSEAGDFDDDGLGRRAIDGNWGAPFFDIVPRGMNLSLNQDLIADCNGWYVAFNRFVTVRGMPEHAEFQ